MKHSSTNKSKFQEHHGVEGESAVRCYLCPKDTTTGAPISFRIGKELKEHLLSSHRNPRRKAHHFLCPLCFFTCPYSSHKRSKKISNHNKTHGENGIQIKCPVPGCGSFETWEEYRHHIRQSHKCQEDPTRFKCYNHPSICKLTFATPWSWLRHVEAEVEVTCGQCTKKFKLPRQLRLHLRNNHLDYTPMRSKLTSSTSTQSSSVPTSYLATSNVFQYHSDLRQQHPLLENPRQGMTNTNGERTVRMQPTGEARDQIASATGTSIRGQNGSIRTDSSTSRMKGHLGNLVFEFEVDDGIDKKRFKSEEEDKEKYEHELILGL